MRPRLLYLFFFITGGLAQETSLPTSADNILLDVKNLPSAKENPAPNPDDSHISNNVEDLQRELIAERIKNRDLNQTISDILERMEDMEKNIMRNEEKIIDNQSSVLLLSRDVDDLQEDVATVQDDVEENSAMIANVFDDLVSLTSSDQQQDVKIESLSSQIDSLGARGHWCGYQKEWRSTVGTITYERLTYTDSNMNITDNPLDINTGINCHKCYYNLDIDICHIDLHCARVWSMETELQSEVLG